MKYIYAVLLLHKLGKEVTEDSVKKVIESTGTEVDAAAIKSMVASLKDVDIEKALSEAQAMPVASSEGKGGAGGEEKKAEVKEEKKAEEAAEGLAALFG